MKPAFPFRRTRGLATLVFDTAMGLASLSPFFIRNQCADLLLRFNSISLTTMNLNHLILFKPQCLLLCDFHPEKADFLISPFPFRLKVSHDMSILLINAHRHQG